MQYGYRTSLLKGNPMYADAVVLDAEFTLADGQRDRLQAKIASIHGKRKASQPSGATCGSVFRNPADDYAGRLIEAAGLKGRRWGNACISQVHANFIVNEDRATAADVKALIDLARDSVLEQFGTELDLEIELLGDW
jgi:UDP-N-acetylmuramate dehydrogenase